MIYEIVCNLTGERYIGSTLNPVDKRIKEHIWDRNKKKVCASQIIINRNNYNYSILEKTDIISRKELTNLEQKWIDKLPNINKNNAYLTDDDKKNYKKIWYENNKEKILNKSKTYYENNKDRIKAYQKDYKKINK
jgi:hypothetical protein